MRDHGVFEEVLPEAVVGVRRVRAKWVNDDRGDSCRERLVAMDLVSFTGARDDNHAMTPLLKVARLLLSLAASRPEGGVAHVIGLHDIRVAFFHATIDEQLVVIMLSGVCAPGKLALLHRALYGTRRASILWQKRVDEVLREAGFVPAVVVPCTYWHEGRQLALIYHGDYFLSCGPVAGQDWLDELLRAFFDTQCLARLGPGFATQDRRGLNVAGRPGADHKALEQACGGHRLQASAHTRHEGNGTRAARRRPGVGRVRGCLGAQCRGLGAICQH